MSDSTDVMYNTVDCPTLDIITSVQPPLHPYFKLFSTFCITQSYIPSKDGIEMAECVAYETVPPTAQKQLSDQEHIYDMVSPVRPA